MKHGYGYTLVFRSEENRTKHQYMGHIEHLLSSEERRKFNSARVALKPDSWATAHLGAPVKWTAPNGVTVVYARGQRRSGDAEKTGEGTSGVYHDFNPDEEYVVALTRGIGASRRALRAWAAAHLGSKVTERFKAKQLVRPGD